MKREHRRREYKCDICEKSLLSMDTLNTHKNLIHQKAKVKLQCRICPRKTYNLQQHYNRTHGHKILYCQSCDFKTSYHHLLKSHVHKEHSKTFFYKTNDSNLDFNKVSIPDEGAQKNQNIKPFDTVTSLNNESNENKTRAGHDTILLAKLGPKELCDEPEPVSSTGIQIILQESKQILFSIKTPETGIELENENKLYSIIENSLEGAKLYTLKKHKQLQH